MLPSVRSLLNEKYYISRQNRKQLSSEMRCHEKAPTTIVPHIKVENAIDFSKTDTLKFLRDFITLFEDSFRIREK
jgi:hypothetical protein